MKTFCLLFMWCFSFTAMQAQTEQVLIAEAIKNETTFNERAALDKLIHVLQLNPHNHYALWKSSELCSRIGSSQPTKDQKIAFYITGRRYAETAIKIDPNDANGYYALSVAMGKLALTVSTKDRINAVKAIKENAEKALRLNPRHGRAWHVLGKWHYEVSNLNFVERTAVRVIYGGFPPASLEQSIKAFEIAQQLESNFALNYLELARAYHRKGDDTKAVSLLRQLATIPNKTSDDNRIKAEGRVLLQSLL